MAATAEIGLIGGSGFYRFLDATREVTIDTPYGPPSDALSVGEVAGRPVAFLPRHGRGHTIPPHRINYRANLWAFASLGVSRVLAPCAVGSLRPDLAPGTFVVCDQLVDRTWGRADTYFDGPEVTHVSLADPYCPELRALAASCLERLGLPLVASGTGVAIQGPRFSTRAESAFYTAQGWDVIGMTQYPEAALAREQELCLLNLSLVTDYDVGLEGMAPVTTAEVVAILRQNNDRLRGLLAELIPRIPATRGCACGSALADAQL
ncbi:MAG TPA: S-methyl-5'-thioadenosine phosphorylase [Actinomycetota bacterium]|nr:S-methyl-5'-thioadenosine phosphorylase [Actinomycetota bacterium]